MRLALIQGCTSSPIGTTVVQSPRGVSVDFCDSMDCISKSRLPPKNLGLLIVSMTQPALPIQS